MSQFIPNSANNRGLFTPKLQTRPRTCTLLLPLGWGWAGHKEEAWALLRGFLTIIVPASFPKKVSFPVGGWHWGGTLRFSSYHPRGTNAKSIIFSWHSWTLSAAVLSRQTTLTPSSASETHSRMMSSQDHV